MPTWNLTPCDGCRRSTRLEHGTSATVAAGRLEELEPGKRGELVGDTQGVSWLSDLGPGFSGGWRLKRPRPRECSFRAGEALR